MRLKVPPKRKQKCKPQANIKYKRALEIANKTAAESDNHLELVKAVRVRRLVEENKDNPEKIDKILSEEFGIIVMTPGDK